MVFCAYKRRSLWKGFFFGKNVFDLICDFESNKTLVFLRPVVLFPYFDSCEYVYQSGQDLLQNNINNSNYYYKVGQLSITKYIGSAIHERKGRKSAKGKKKG